MSDSEPKLPDAPGAGTPPPTPPTGGPSDPPIDPNPPAEPLPTEPGSPAVAPPGLPDAPPAPGMEPTTQMPTIDAPPSDLPVDVDGLGAGVAAGTPPVDPPDAPVDPNEDPDEAVPWYKKPGPVAALVVAVLLIGGLLAWLLLGGDDDSDQASATSTFLVFETSDETGAKIDVGFIVDVTGPADAPKAFIWLIPDGASPGETAGASTGSDGRVAFEWEADDTVADPASWQSTVTAVAEIPAGWTPPGPNVDCVLRPFDGPATTVTVNIETDSNDESVDRVGTVTFPNYTFSPGDSVTCKLVAGAPAPTTVVETTVVETTVVETTVVETTVAETTVPPATTPPATTPPATTTPGTTVPALPATAYEALADAGIFTSFLAAVDQFPDVKALLEGPGPVTVLAPNDDAFDGVTLPTDPADVEELLLSHIVDGDALDIDQIRSLQAIVVATGGTQPVDATTNVTVIGGADVIVTIDNVADNGLFHELDAIMPVAPAP